MKVEKLKSGNYRIRVIIGHDDSGKPLRKSFTHHDKKHLLAVAHQYADVHRNVSRRKTVEQAAESFLSAKTPVLSPSTVRAYTSIKKTLIREHGAFCGLYIDDMKQSDAQHLINSLVAKGNSPKTVRNVHAFLTASFKYQGERFPEVNLPQKEKPVIHIPDEDIAKKIADAAKGTRLEVPVALAFFALRRSEICALSKDDLYDNVIHIHKAAVYGADKAIHVKNPKTYTSDRYIRIPAELAEKIRAQGVCDYTPAGLSHAFKRMLKTNGLPDYRLHDLRHFFVSYCHNVLHLSDAQIQSITGHKTSVVMQNYLHSMNDDTAGKLVVDSLSKLL